MDLDELRAFLTIIEQGSLLEAARVLGVSRTTLRRKAEALEARVGVPLYATTSTGVQVTDAGRALVEHGRRLVEESAAVLSAVREVNQTPSGDLRVVLPAGLPPQAAVQLVTGLRHLYPHVSIRARIVEDPLTSRLDDVDLVLHVGRRAVRGAWITRRIYHLKLWLVASPAYLERHGTPRSLEDLAHHTVFRWKGPEDDADTLPLVSGGTMPVSPRLVSSDIHALRQCAIAGLGMALVPDGRLPDPGYATPPVVPVLPDLVGGDLGLWAAIPEALKNVSRVRALLEMMSRMAPEEPAAEFATQPRKKARKP